jgi:hypothetical protein
MAEHCALQRDFPFVMLSGVSRSPAQGGLEGCKPSKSHCFLVVIAGKAGNNHQKKKISGGKASPNPTIA